MLHCSISVERESDYRWEIGSPCLLFNCLANCNMNHLSLCAAERQPVEILLPLRLLLTAQQPCTVQIYLSFNHTHIYVWQDRCHTLYISSCILTIFSWAKKRWRREKGADFQQSASSGEESGWWDSLSQPPPEWLPIYHTQLPVSPFYHIYWMCTIKNPPQQNTNMWT